MSKSKKAHNEKSDQTDKFFCCSIVIETPKGCRNKYKFDEKERTFSLSGVLPCGSVFPYDFGFIPKTLGEDGDPLDVLILMDEPAFAGCVIEARLIGVIEAEQTEDGETLRNDRLIGVAETSRTHRDVKLLSQINGELVHEIEHFFVSYNEMKKKQFKPLRRVDADAAIKLMKKGKKRFHHETD